MIYAYPTRALSALGVIVLLAAAPHASAAGDDDVTRAKALYKKADVHFNLGEYRVALDLYREAYRAKALPGFLFNIAQCHFNLAEYREALDFYERYLVQQPEAPNRSDVEQQITRCRERIAAAEREGAGSGGAGSGGAGSGGAGSGGEGGAGTGGTGTARDGTTGGAGRGQGGGAGSATGDDPAAGTTGTSGGASAVTTDTPRDAQPTRGQKILLWSGVGLAAALLVAGGVTRGVALAQASEYEDPNTPLARQLELRDSGTALTTASTVLLVGGAAVAVGTALYYGLSYRKAYRNGSGPRAGVLLHPGGAVASFDVSF